MHTFLDHFQQGGKYSAQIASHQAELRREEKIVVSIGKMTRQTHPRVMTLIHPRTVIIDVNDAKIRNI